MASTNNDNKDIVVDELNYTPHVNQEITPCLGMEFDSDELAYQFYNEYERYAGFSIRKQYRTQSRKDGIMNNQRFVCSKEGERAKLRYGQAVISRVKLTRTKCRACLGVRLSRETNKWFVTAFSEVHNHELHKPEVTHMMLSQR
ncbi:Protein FAR-RED IMPAIRED RESPONSE 1 [Platanthera zijinensis]|uniref:Protein FAR-RED IMPAIRED RESPONSE 1 n=1 Tax=Platanthera zijinensis TaxID=2320716 RepID=A0AAP0GAH6_9ASPA